MSGGHCAPRVVAEVCEDDGMFERFSDEARRTVVRALVEARLLGHDYVGTEHTLIALATAPGSTATALASEGVTLERARDAVADAVDMSAASASWDDGPYTARAKHTFELGLREAFGLDHPYVANGHLLLGLLRLGQGNGLRALEVLGVDLASLRHKVESSLGSEAPPPPPVDRLVAISAGSRLAIKQPAELDLREPSVPAEDDGEITVPQHGETTNGAAPERRSTCSFCNTELGPDDRFVAGASARICLECVRASARLLGAMDALSQDFTLVFDGARRTATLSLG